MSDCSIVVLAGVVLSLLMVALHFVVSRKRGFRVRSLYEHDRLVRDFVRSHPASPDEIERLISSSRPEIPSVSDSFLASMSPAEMRTRSLIGDKAFDRMQLTVDSIVERHKGDKSTIVSLTSGCDSRDAARRLHSLLPGDELCLRKSVECGLPLVDVYAGGYRIGRLLLGDAEVAFDVMEKSVLTGAYVSEQNCYGNCSAVDLRIILFYGPRPSFADTGTDEKDTPYKITVKGVKPIVLFQN